MPKSYRTLIEKYFDEHSFVESNINSFNNFIGRELQNIVDENREVVPTIIPPEIEDFKIRLGKIWVTKPEIVEADGSRRAIFPIEARLRNITYSAPIFLEVSTIIDGVQRENFSTQVGKIPIMLKSNYCHLNKLKHGELIEKGEDPDDPGGYFILNGNERVLINVEDLASNKLLISENNVGPSRFTGRLFSEKGALKIPHTIEQMKDGIIYLSFTTFKRVPIIAVIKSLGLCKDEEIMKLICEDKQYDDVFINLYGSVDLKTVDQAQEFIGKSVGLTISKEDKLVRIQERLDRYLLPHLGTDKESRMIKAYNLCKHIKKFLMVSRDGVGLDDKDHYMNKRLKLSGDLLADLFRVNLRILVGDMLYNFQRLVKRGKFHSTKIIIREKLLTSRIKSAMATGSWVGARSGVTQNIDRTNFLSSQSHLQRVVSLLSATQENFEARALHCTHFGRLCPVETPEGTPIGLRKNFAMLINISHEDLGVEKIKKILEANGLK